MEKIKILFLAANPSETSRLKLDEEARAIQSKIRASASRDHLELITRWAVRPDDLQQELLEVMPHVLHFSGHGTSHESIVLVDSDSQPKLVSTEALEGLVKVLKGNLRLVFLNACFSRPQAEAITKHIDFAVGMNQGISDLAAITFAGSFYRAIGFGKSVRRSFEIGQNALLLDGIPEHATPELIVRKGEDSSDPPFC